jgi:putative DNA primase/helicase
MHREIIGAWDPEVIDQAIPTLAALGIEPASGEPHEASSEPPVKLDERGYEAWRGDLPKIKDGKIDRSVSLLQIGRALFDAGANRAVIEEALRERDQALGWEKYSGRDDAGGRYAEIVDELEKNGRNRRIKRRDAAGFNLTDLGNASRLVAHHGNDLRYCYPWGSWLIWDGRRWSLDESGEIHRRAKRTVREIYREAADAADDKTREALGKHAKASEAENRIQAMISLAKSEVPIMPAAMDRDPWLLNVGNGTLDLRTGELLEHRREDLLTKLAGEYDPEASASTWTSTLERVLPSAEVRAFFKRLCGYAISGDVSEHVLPVLYGTGANGKSTILNALLEAAGEYGMQAAPDLLIAKRGGHPTEVADLFGMRFVASIEVEDGRRLAESLVKTLTGGDKVRARRMRQDFWEFDPTHKVFMAVNHKPQVRGNDNAIWRRIRLLPFEQTIPPAEQDKKLPEKLRAELPGILAWAVEGCLEWRREGLKAPEEVRKATGRYRSEMDVIGAFLKDCCEEGAEHDVAAKDLYARYKTWCDENGEAGEKQRTFGSKLSERGYERYRGGASGGHRWRGLTLCKSAFCRGSDRTDIKVPIAGSKSTHVEGNGILGSEGAEGSVEPTEEQPLHRDPEAWFPAVAPPPDTPDDQWEGRF